MSIAVGETLPTVTLYRLGASGPEGVDSAAVLNSGTVALFLVPGAFTPVCSNNHLPGYVAHGPALKAKGVDRIVCVAVNDPFVLDAWAKSQASVEGVEILSDGNGALAKALGIVLDASGFGLGIRSHRAALVVKDGVVQSIAVEENPTVVTVSGAEAMVAAL